MIFNNIQIRFRWNADGIYDPTLDGIIDECFCAAYTYANKARLCLGETKVQLLDGIIVGRRCKVHNCSGKRIITVCQWHKKVADEVRILKIYQVITHSG